MRQQSSLARLLASAAVTAMLAAGLGGCQTMADITGSITSSKAEASPDADPRRYGTFRNVVALDRGGRQVWVAETPTTSTGDCYYHIASAKPLIAYSTQSFDCTIDPTSGRITEQVFTK